LLEKANIVTDLPEIIRPEDFKDIKGIHEIYGGLLRNYRELN